MDELGTRLKTFLINKPLRLKPPYYQMICAKQPLVLVHHLHIKLFNG